VSETGSERSPGDAAAAPGATLRDVRKRLATNAPALGGAPLGNLFAPLEESDAEGVVRAALAAGVSYFDTAPHYGHGLSEHRMGRVLRRVPRERFVLSTKVGRLLAADPAAPRDQHGYVATLPFTQRYDYTADGVRRSIEDSLQRLGVDSLDIAFVHDISPDFAFFPNGWEEQYEISRKGAFPALSKMRDEGIIRAWGIGVNTPLPILKVMEDADPDVCLCARQYSLIDHASAVNELFPAVRKKGISLIIGSSLNAGFISGSPRYNYGKENFKIPAEVIDKRARLQKVACRHGVDLRTAALQFSAAADVAVALVVGARSDQQILQDWNSLQTKVPTEFWDDLRSQSLIEAGAAVPSSAEN
jgi:D-threo-aldose 1-dehydrogenase